MKPAPTSTDRVLDLLDRYPYASATEVAEALKLSRARVYQIMRAQGVWTQRQTIPREGAVVASGREPASTQEGP